MVINLLYCHCNECLFSCCCWWFQYPRLARQCLYNGLMMRQSSVIPPCSSSGMQSMLFMPITVSIKKFLTILISFAWVCKEIMRLPSERLHPRMILWQFSTIFLSIYCFSMQSFHLLVSVECKWHIVSQKYKRIIDKREKCNGLCDKRSILQVAPVNLLRQRVILYYFSNSNRDQSGILFL